MNSRRAPIERRSASARAALLLLASTLGLAVNCTVDDMVVRRVAGPTQSSSPDGGGGASPAPSGDASCSVAPYILAGGTSPQLGNTCPGWAARRSFSHALCTCGDLDAGGVFLSTAFDSAATGPESGGAAVGVNGKFADTDYLRLDGSLTIAGALGFSVGGGFDVRGDLKLGGPAAAIGPVLIARDAWVQDDVSSLSLVGVARDLHVGPNGAVSALGPVLVGGQRFDEAFTSEPPCACDPSEILDVASIVSDGMVENDNARIGLDPGALEAPLAPVTLSLDCGRFALRRIAGALPVNLVVSGRVVLFVEAQSELGPEFRVELEPGAELDWFVGGAVSLSAGARIGDTARAGAVRLYTTAPAEIALPGTDEVAVNLYAPLANVTVGGIGEVHGALFAANVVATSALVSRYDRAVLNVDPGCPAASAGCGHCADCAGSACVAGMCQACSSDADCCSPLICDLGECVPLRGD